MREIKFRAWHKNTERMINWDKLFSVMNLGDIFDSEYFCALQYTGLKDKNGREIYEGDIDKDKEIIEFIDGSFCIGQVPLHACKVNKIEIIGNVYENPELIK